MTVELEHPAQPMVGWPTSPMLAAAKRFKKTYDASMDRITGGHATTPVDIVEMQQATLGLMWATQTRTLQEALDVLHDVESRHGPSTD